MSWAVVIIRFNPAYESTCKDAADQIAGMLDQGWFMGGVGGSANVGYVVMSRWSGTPGLDALQKAHREAGSHRPPRAPAPPAPGGEGTRPLSDAGGAEGGPDEGPGLRRKPWPGLDGGHRPGGASA